MSTHPPTTEYGDLNPSLPLTVSLIDEPIHLAPSSFCATGEPTCLCQEDPALIANVAGQVEQGLLTPAEATRIVHGTQITMQGGAQ